MIQNVFDFCLSGILAEERVDVLHESFADETSLVALHRRNWNTKLPYHMYCQLLRSIRKLPKKLGTACTCKRRVSYGVAQLPFLLLEHTPRAWQISSGLSSSSIRTSTAGPYVLTKLVHSSAIVDGRIEQTLSRAAIISSCLKYIRIFHLRKQTSVYMLQEQCNLGGVVLEHAVQFPHNKLAQNALSRRRYLGHFRARFAESLHVVLSDSCGNQIDESLLRRLH